MEIKINVKWLILAIGIVAAVGIVQAYPTIGDPDVYFGFIHGDGGNVSNLPAAQVKGNFTQRINFSNTIYATGLTATVPSDSAICLDIPTSQFTVNTGIVDCSASSEAVKENIRPLTESNIPDNFDKLNPVTFNYKNDPTKREKIGLLAQELIPIYPEAVGYGTDGEVRGINYYMLIPVLIEKLQEQQNININQQNEINTLKYELELLKGNKATVAPTPIPTTTPAPSFWEFWK
jgi:hypothetical protein